MSRHLWHAQGVNGPNVEHEFICRFQASRTVTVGLADQVTLITIQIITQAHKENRGCGPSNRTEHCPFAGYSFWVQLLGSLDEVERKKS